MWKFLATRPLGRIFIFVNSSFKLLDLKLFHGLRTTEEPSLRSSLKSFHKEYPSFQPVQEHLLLLSSPPRFFRFFVLILHVSPSRRFFPSRYQFNVSSGFFISIVFCYFTFLEMCITGQKHENSSDSSFLFEGAYSSLSILERVHSFLDAKNCWASFGYFES